MNHKAIFEKHGEKQVGQLGLEKLYQLFKSRIYEEIYADVLRDLKLEIVKSTAKRSSFARTVKGSLPHILDSLRLGAYHTQEVPRDRTVGQQRALTQQIIARSQALKGKEFSLQADEVSHIILIKRVL